MENFLGFRAYPLKPTSRVEQGYKKREIERSSPLIKNQE